MTLRLALAGAAAALLAACATPEPAPAPRTQAAVSAASGIAQPPGADRHYGPGPAVAAAAPAAPARDYVELTNPADGTRIAVKRGGELKLVIDARPVNQLQWKQVAVIAPTLSPIGERAYVSKSMNPLDLTAGGWNIFRYRAEQPGNVTLVLELAATDVPQPAARVVRYDVKVE